MEFQITVRITYAIHLRPKRTSKFFHPLSVVRAYILKVLGIAFFYYVIKFLAARSLIERLLSWFLGQRVKIGAFSHLKHLNCNALNLHVHLRFPLFQVSSLFTNYLLNFWVSFCARNFAKPWKVFDCVFFLQPQANFMNLNCVKT